MSNERDSLARVVGRLIEIRSIRPTDLINQTKLSRQTIYSLIQGKGTPQQDTLLRVARVIGSDPLVPRNIEYEKMRRVFEYLNRSLEPGADADEIIADLENDEKFLTQSLRTPLTQETRELLEKTLNRPGVATRFAALIDSIEELSDEEAVQLLDAINQMTEIGRRRAGM